MLNPFTSKVFDFSVISLEKNLPLNGDVLDLISQCHSFPFFSFALLLCRGQLPTVILSCHLAKAFRQNQII